MDGDNRENIILHSFSKGVLALFIVSELLFFTIRFHTGSFLPMNVFCYT